MAQMNVRYVGVADERSISPAQLREVGVDYSGPTLKFNRRNRFKVEDVPVDDGLEEVLRADGAFILEAVADSGEERAVAGADNPSVEADVIVDGNTGATSPTKSAKARGSA